VNHTAFSLIIIFGLVSIALADTSSMAQYRFLVGNYECIGRWPDSKKTYTGRVEISELDDGVKMVRTINGKKVEAVGKYGTATPDEIRVLRVKFIQDGVEYDETCMVSGDLDNYSRITCYVYTGNSKRVGLETLFPDYGQLKRP
jgi:hypothetical protein